MTSERVRAIEERLAKATQAVDWYPHGAGSAMHFGSNLDATVRGPFHRWLIVKEVSEQYRHNVAPVEADAMMFAHAPSDLRYLLGLLGEARTTLRIIADGIHEELATAGAREFLKKLEGA